MNVYPVLNKGGVIFVKRLKKRGINWASHYPKQWQDIRGFIIRIYNEFTDSYPSKPVPMLYVVEDPFRQDVYLQPEVYFRIGSDRVNTRLFAYDSNGVWKPLWENVDEFVCEIKSIGTESEDVEVLELQKKVLDLERTVRDLQEKLASLTVIVTSHPALKPKS